MLGTLRANKQALLRHAERDSYHSAHLTKPSARQADTSCEQVLDHVPVDVGQAALDAVVVPGECFVVDTEQVQDGGVEVGPSDGVFDGPPANFVGRAVRLFLELEARRIGRLKSSLENANQQLQAGEEKHEEASARWEKDHTKLRSYLKLMATTHFDRKLRARVSPSDVVQETLLEAHRGFPVFRGGTEPEFVAWLRQILMHNLLSAVRSHLMAQKRDVRREVSIHSVRDSFERSRTQLDAFLMDRGPSPSDNAQHREHAVLLADLLAELSADHRRVLMLRHLDGLGFNEIAAHMNRTAPATRILWLRAVEKLRRRLKVRQR